MPVKLLMTWDIAPEHEQDYFEFVLTEFVPGLQRLGLQPAEAWATIYGNYPQIQVGVIAPSLKNARNTLGSESWMALQDKLSAFIRNYNCKIVPVRNGFQF